MSPEEEKDFNELLTTFDAMGLGQGDRVAGTNLLAAMASALANVSRTGSGIQSHGIGRLRAGASVLVTGSMSSSLVTDNVVTEVAICQNNLSAQVLRLMGDKLADAQKKGLKVVEFPSGPKANPSENALFLLEQKDSPFTIDVQETWMEVLRSAPNPRIGDLVSQLKVYVTATGAADLLKQLTRLHGGRPFVSLGLNRSSDVAARGDTCTALIDGRFTTGLFGETAAGNLLITDPASVLAGAAKSDCDKTNWLGRMLWLVDGDAGPELPDFPKEMTEVRLTNMGERFGTALHQAFAGRLNNHDAGTVVHELDTTKAQFRWVKFLKGMEKHLPGISGTARGLLPTLTFGLIELSHAKGLKRLEVNLAGVEAFARHLVRRMAMARAAILFSADEAQKLKDMRRIFSTLGDKQMTNRDIYRTLTLPAAYCEELLLEMEAGDLVHRAGVRWGRAEGVTVADLPTHRLLKTA